MPDDFSDGLRAATWASASTVIELWPEGPARTIEEMPPESTFRLHGGVASGTTTLRNVARPTLSVYLPEPEKATGDSVVICPGGGWKLLFWENEGVDVAEWFTRRGYAAFLLKYRLEATPADSAEFAALLAKLEAMAAEPLPAASAPTRFAQLVDADHEARGLSADDGRRALQIVRERAGEFGLDAGRVGLIGFSVGAAVAVDVAMDPHGPPPAFLAAIYGGDANGRPISADAPPLFTVVALDDRIHFRVVETLYRDWSEADRPAELHVFARGGHSFGMVRQGLPSDRWIDLMGDWLADLGFG